MMKMNLSELGLSHQVNFIILHHFMMSYQVKKKDHHLAIIFLIFIEVFPQLKLIIMLNQFEVLIELQVEEMVKPIILEAFLEHL